MLIGTYTNQGFCEGDQRPAKLALIHFEALVLLLSWHLQCLKEFHFFYCEIDEGNHKPIGAAYQQIWVVKGSMLLCCVKSALLALGDDHGVRECRNMSSPAKDQLTPMEAQNGEGCMHRKGGSL